MIDLNRPHRRFPASDREAGQIFDRLRKASGAVGMTCNRNRIMIAVSCQRVVGADGSTIVTLTEPI